MGIVKSSEQGQPSQLVFIQLERSVRVNDPIFHNKVEIGIPEIPERVLVHPRRPSALSFPELQPALVALGANMDVHPIE